MPTRTTRRVDEPRRSCRHVRRQVSPITGATDRICRRGDGDEAQALVRRAVPSRGDAHASRARRCCERFVVDICGCATLWTRGQHHRGPDRARARAGRRRRRAAGTFRRRRFLGGRRAAAQRAIGDRLTCVFVDTGLLRWQEGDQVMATMADARWACKVIRVDAAARYFEALARRCRSGSQAQDHRPAVRRNLRRGVGKAATAAT